jgi:diguanylate cyclase (GGDEF)-like protein/PAS domain S-box-containing protein
MGDSPRRGRNLEPVATDAPIDPGSGLRLRSAEEETYRALFRLSPKPMWVYDVETQAFLDVNDAAVKDYGFTRDEFLAMTVADIRVGESEARHRKKDGSVFEADTSTEDISYGGRAARLVLAMDVTRRRRAEVALLESERRFRALLETVQLVAVVLDEKGTVTFCNDYFLGLAGHARADVLGRDWFDLCVPEAEREARRTSYEEKLTPGLIAPHDESSILTGTGELRRIFWHNTVLRHADGTAAGAARIGVDVTEQRAAEAKIEHDALHDALTGLPNRTLFLERLRAALLRAKRRKDYVFAVLFVDLDRFKVINEGLGHSAGDRLLVEAARVLETCVRPQDTVARLGGDEFTILLDDVRDELYATRVASRIQRALLSPFDLGGHEAFTSASIGIALSSAGYERAEDVMRDADTAMYRAKALGKARHEIFDTSMHRRAVALMQLETDVRRAVERTEFSLAYQPIVSLRTGRIEGFEALLRWDHPLRGPIPPAELVPVAEETGLIQPIGRWVLDEACREMSRWLSTIGANDNRPLYVCVNLSGKQFSEPGLTREIAEVMRTNGLEPRRLKLEITESAIMHDPEQAVAMMRELRAHGFGLSIDDFGTGYSSLSYLLRFPIDTLKIDRTFVAGMEHGGENQELVRTIVTLARNLSMHVVAEGVETDAQRIRLEALGCDSAQGFLFSQPVPGEAARGLIR